MRRVTSVHPIDGFRLELVFDDSTAGTVDLSDLAGRGVFASWLETDGFGAVRIGDQGELLWGDQVDLCPDSLYLRLTGKTPESLFPSLRSVETHA